MGSFLISVFQQFSTCRKDSFVTHRAFCDALSEENYRLNQNLTASAQELFSSSHVAIPDTCTNTNPNGLMNMSTCVIPQDHALIKPLSLNSNGMMIPTNLDPFYSARTLSANSKTIGGLSSSSPLALGSAYTSATALLQKAAEIGSKTSDTSLTPILLRGFTGYFTGSRNASATASNGIIHAENLETTDDAMGRGQQRNSYEIPQMGLYDLSAFMHSSGQSSSGPSQRQLLVGEHEKMTVDFLGVEPPDADHSSFSKKRKYGDDTTDQLGSIRQSLQDLHTEW